MEVDNNIFNQWHLENPWTLPPHAEGRNSLKTLSTVEKVISVILLIFALPFAIVGGLFAFYGITSFFKERMISNITPDLENPAPPRPTAKKTEEVKQQTLLSPKKDDKSLTEKPKTIPPKADEQKTTIPKVKHLPTDLDVKKLTVNDIRKMTPDEQGELIDRYARRKVNGPCELSQLQLRAMIQSQDPKNIKMISTQETGKGHCGRYCINNALQKQVLSQNEFLESTANAFVKLAGFNPEDAAMLVNNDDDFAIDAGIVSDILESKCGIKTKTAIIEELPDAKLSKQHALEQFIGEAEYVIVGSTGDTNYEMPSLTAPYPLAKAHFVAMRKDSNGKWWYIDSRAHQPTNISLAVLPKICRIIVPV